MRKDDFFLACVALFAVAAYAVTVFERAASERPSERKAAKNQKKHSSRFSFTMPTTTRRRSTLSPVVLDVLPALPAAAPPPPPPQQQQRKRLLKVVTLNCWGLLFPASRARKRRVEAIGRALMESSLVSSSSTSSVSTSTSSSAPPDVVCLQEVWCAADARSIASQAALGGHLVYSHHFRNGAFGSGLLTLSAFPILGASFSAFAAAGDPLAVLQGDGVAGKGVGCVALDVSGNLGARREEEKKAAKGKSRGGGGGGRATKEEENDEDFAPSPSSEVLVVANTHLAAAYKDAHEGEEEGEEEAAAAGRNSGGSSKAAAKKTKRGASSYPPSSSSPPPRPPRLPFSVPSDANGPVRLAQMIALAESVGAFAAATGARRALLCGDLNSTPRSLEVALLRRLSPLPSTSTVATSAKASSSSSSSSSSLEAPLGDAWDFLEERKAAARGGFDADGGEDEPPATPGRDRWGGATANRPLEGSKKPAAAAATTAGAGKRPARIDFIWSFSPPSTLLPVSAEITMTRDAGTGRRLSDHAGVEVIFELDPSPPPPPPPSSLSLLVDPLAASVPLIEKRASRARASADAAGVASAGCLLAAVALSSATLLRLSSSSSSSSWSSFSFSSSSSSLVVALALALSFALGALSALLFALGYGGRHAFAAALGASAERARLGLDAERRRADER